MVRKKTNTRSGFSLFQVFRKENSATSARTADAAAGTQVTPSPPPGVGHPGRPPGIIVSNPTLARRGHASSGKLERMNGDGSTFSSHENLTSINDEMSTNSASNSAGITNMQPTHRPRTTPSSTKAITNPLMTHGGFGAVLGFTASSPGAALPTPSVSPNAPPMSAAILTASSLQGATATATATATASTLPSLGPTAEPPSGRSESDHGGEHVPVPGRSLAPAVPSTPLTFGSVARFPSRHAAHAPPTPAASAAATAQLPHGRSPSDGTSFTPHPPAASHVSTAGPSTNFHRSTGFNRSMADPMLQSMFTPNMVTVLPVGFGSSISVAAESFACPAGEPNMRPMNPIHSSQMIRSTVTSGSDAYPTHTDMTASLSYAALGPLLGGGFNALFSTQSCANPSMGMTADDAAQRSTSQSMRGGSAGTSLTTGAPPMSAPEMADEGLRPQSSNRDLSALRGAAAAAPTPVNPLSAADALQSEVDLARLQSALGDDALRLESIAAAAARLTHHLNEAVQCAKLLRAPATNVEFGFSDRRATLALFQFAGLEEDPHRENPTKFQLRLQSYRFPPPNMEALAELDAPDEGTLLYMLGPKELRRRRRMAARQAQDLARSREEHGRGRRTSLQERPRRSRGPVVTASRPVEAKASSAVFRRPEEIRGHVRRAVSTLPPFAEGDSEESSADESEREGPGPSPPVAELGRRRALSGAGALSIEVASAATRRSGHRNVGFFV